MYRFKNEYSIVRYNYGYINRESCAVTLSEASTKEEAKELLDLWQQKCRQSYSIG